MRITELVDAIVQRAIRRVSVGEEQVHHEVFIRLVEAPVEYLPEVKSAVSPFTHYMAETPQVILVLTMAGIHPGDTIVRRIVFQQFMPNETTVDQAVMEELASMREEKVRQARQIEQAVGGN